MSVWVDNMRCSYRGMFMCHMIADSREELLAMADAIGVQRKWIQKPYTYKEHFDVCLSKRKLACQHGAIPISQRSLFLKIRAKKLNEIQG